MTPTVLAKYELVCRALTWAGPGPEGPLAVPARDGVIGSGPGSHFRCRLAVFA